MNRRALTLLTMLLLLALGACQQQEPWQNNRISASPLVIYGTLGAPAFAPLIADFHTLHPQIDVQYHKINAGPLQVLYLQGNASGHNSMDLLISSAMDLQVKLVNDGHAATHHSAYAQSLPAWAKWRNQAFAITVEPIVMVFNRRLMRGRTIPRSRSELLDALSSDPAFWRHRVGTFDVRSSSVGYLLASQDAREGFDFGSLMQAFRNAGLMASGDTTLLFDKIERGDLVMGYNLLGSFAWRRQQAGAPIEIVYPTDYTLAVSRVALIPRDAPHTTAAHLFLDYLLSPRGQQVLVTRCELAAVRPEIISPFGSVDHPARQTGPLRAIALGPGLLTYLDSQKRARLLDIWDKAVGKTAPAANTPPPSPTILRPDPRTTV